MFNIILADPEIKNGGGGAGTEEGTLNVRLQISTMTARGVKRISLMPHCLIFGLHVGGGGLKYDVSVPSTPSPTNTSLIYNDVHTKFAGSVTFLEHVV